MIGWRGAAFCLAALQPEVVNASAVHLADFLLNKVWRQRMSAQSRRARLQK
jgi:hypothetical protein